MGNEEDDRDKDLTGDFIKQHEGLSAETYEDTKGIPTIGYGGNLQSPEMPEILEEVGVDPEMALQGKVRLGKDTSEKIFQKQRAEKEQYFDNIKQKDFPNSDISENERAALVSMGYNSPRLWGPKLRKMLQMNDDIGVAREIMLGSNKNKVPGIQKRRLEEARMYSGDNFEQVYKTLSPQEKEEMRNIILQIKNVHERQRVLEEFPFLKPELRFNKLRKP